MALTDDKRKKIKKYFWRTFFIGIGTLVLMFSLISIGWLGYLPDIKELQNPINKSATEIYSSDMVLLGRFSLAKENRVPINYNYIDKDVINALIAT